MVKKTTLIDIAAIMEKGFAAVADDFADIRKDMATKEDFKNFATKDDIASLKIQVHAIQKKPSTTTRSSVPT